MRTAKSYENGIYSSDSLKSKATNTKRLLGGLRNIDSSILELNAKESQQLSDAISLVIKISDLYTEATRFKKRAEKAQAIEYENIAKLVNASAFAQLSSVSDKVAFISHISKWALDSADKGAWNARYCMSDSFRNALKDMCIDISVTAKTKAKTHQQVLDEVWVKFQESLPERHKRYSGLIERMEKLLAEDQKKA